MTEQLATDVIWYGSVSLITLPHKSNTLHTIAFEQTITIPNKRILQISLPYCFVYIDTYLASVFSVSQFSMDWCNISTGATQQKLWAGHITHLIKQVLIYA